MNCTQNRTLQGILVGVVALTFCTTVNAQLMGHEVRADWRYPEFDTVLEWHIVTVSDGVELPADVIKNSTVVDIDIGDDWIELRFNDRSDWPETDFNGWYFSDINGTIPDITGYSILDYSSGVINIDKIVTGFNAHAFWADFGGVRTLGESDWIRMSVNLDPPSSCLDLAVSTLTAGQRATWSISGATPGAGVAVVWGTAPGSTVLNGFAGYCADFGIKGVNAKRVVCRKTADGSGNVSCKKNLPGGISGLRVLSQAAERGTCPDACMSNLDDQVVQ